MSEYICRLFAPEASLSSTSTATPKPAVVMVPDACHVSAHYAGLVSSLQRAGYGVIMPGLPSVSSTPPSNAFEADVQQVRNT
ncbi:hypothetical protein LTR37_017942, partial [Vermiconidia calcicola]